MKNGEIYTISEKLLEAFGDNNQKLPIRINFYLQKNKNNLINLAKDIETARMDILRAHAVQGEDGKLQVPEDALAAANLELQELYNLEQDVQIYKVKVDSLPESIVLTTGQMEVLMFMLE